MTSQETDHVSPTEVTPELGKGVLLVGPPGLGKTTLAQIVALELSVNFRSTSGPVIAKLPLLAMSQGTGRSGGGGRHTAVILARTSVPSTESVSISPDLGLRSPISVSIAIRCCLPCRSSMTHATLASAILACPKLKPSAHSDGRPTPYRPTPGRC
jgi:hypothetical protein